LTFARVLIAHDQTDDALRLLERIGQIAEASMRMGRMIEVLALQALALERQGNTVGALTALRQALTRAEPEGYIRTFVDEGVPMAALLERGLEVGGWESENSHQDIALRAYARSLLNAFDRQPHRLDHSPHRPRASQTTGPLVEPLSERELDVLRHIAAGLSYQEIAQASVVSINTVKTQVKSLYSKLGVHSRDDAIAAARALHLVS
jgi:LuxR family maltose regulon positive regulatory protein